MTIPVRKHVVSCRDVELRRSWWCLQKKVTKQLLGVGLAGEGMRSQGGEGEYASTAAVHSNIIFK